jgi:hypothetical protein
MTAGRTINTQSQHWGTPKIYVDAVKKVFGGTIDLDPCSNEFSIVKATTEYRLPKQDGLYDSWNFQTIYVNPPYGLDKSRGTSIKQWLARCYDAYKTYHSQVIALVPVATNTGHWKNFVFGKAQAICFLYDTRLKFFTMFLSLMAQLLILDHLKIKQLAKKKRAYSSPYKACFAGNK